MYFFLFVYLARMDTSWFKKNLSLGSVSKFTQDLLNDSPFNTGKEHGSDDEEEEVLRGRTALNFRNDDLTEQLNKLQEQDSHYEKVKPPKK